WRLKPIVGSPSGCTCGAHLLGDAIHRTVISGLGPQSAQRCYSRDAIETRTGVAQKAKEAKEVFLVAAPPLWCCPHQRHHHPEVTEKDFLRFLRIFRRVPVYRCLALQPAYPATGAGRR